MDRWIVDEAVKALHSCRALLVTAGAGMGVDSGLPDFRGAQGFWRAYPAYQNLGLAFEQMADPKWFETDPARAWGFYGHRLRLYRETVPHRGFEILRRMGEGKSNFVFTSNVDGQFQRAGWAEHQIHECHGSIHWMQCLEPCGEDIWKADGFQPVVDLTTFRAAEPFPTCPRCGGMTRPNIQLFADWGFLRDRTSAQANANLAWLGGITPSELVVVEIGAGTEIPSVRGEGENLAVQGARLIRINPRESWGPLGTLSFDMGGLEALELLGQGFGL